MCIEIPRWEITQQKKIADKRRKDSLNLREK